MKIKWWEYGILGLLLISGWNWGSAVLFNYNIVEEIIKIRFLQDVAYGLIFLASFYAVYLFGKMLKK